jgi:hypothetical protein
MKNTMKGTRMNSKATAAALSLAIPLAAVAQTSVEDHQSKIEKALEQAVSKQGLSVGGLATGELLFSKLSGSSMKDSLRTSEAVAYTQVDFDLKARPNSTTLARAVFRMHMDWPNFFGNPSTPIETRWLSLDGKAIDMLYYSVGDMSLKWSPYTLWSPDVGFLYTPRLFAQAQQQAMYDRFQGENVRNLQGIQFGIRAAAPEIAIDSFNVGVLGSKLYTADHSQAEQLKASYPFVWGKFDRYLVGGRGDVTFLKGASLGATYLVEKDLRTTYANQDTTESARLGRDSAQAGSVISARVGVQGDRFADFGGLTFGLNAEYAMSSWDGAPDHLDTTVAYKLTHGFDTTGAPQRAMPAVGAKIDGKALNAVLNVGYQIPKVMVVKLNGGYLMNDSGFRSDAAQSPTFRGGRILNTEQGWNTWNTFDAMYHNVYRFIPEANSNETVKNPVEKNNYTNQVLDPSQYSLKNLDWNVQMVLPNGLATANRVGPKVDLDASFLDGAVDVRASVAMLAEAKASYAKADTVGGSIVENDSVLSKASYQKMQFGAKVRVDKFLEGIWDLPLEFAGSFEQNSGKASNSVLDYKNSVINVGAYIAVHKRLALLAGYQMIDGKQNTSFADSVISLSGVAAPVSNKQTNLGLGLEVKIQEGAYLVAMWNQLSTKYPNLTKQDFDQAITNVKLQVAF